MDVESKFDEIYIAKFAEDNSYVLIHSVIDNKVLLRKFPTKIFRGYKL